MLHQGGEKRYVVLDTIDVENQRISLASYKRHLEVDRRAARNLGDDPADAAGSPIGAL